MMSDRLMYEAPERLHPSSAEIVHDAQAEYRAPTASLRDGPPNLGHHHLDEQGGQDEGAWEA